MEKEWQLMPKCQAIYKTLSYSETMLQLLFNRGLKNTADIEAFLNPDLKNGLFDPFLFKQMEDSVDLIIKHIKNGSKITIYGDYDADGVTATAVMFETLAVLKADVDIYIPERVSEGYGLNQEAIREIASLNTKLIITVDNGIRNKDEVEFAKELGLEVIITDHHRPPVDDLLPDCLVITSQIQDSGYPEKNLAGVGVAFKLANALINKSNLTPKQKNLLVGKAYDLVAIGTIADCVSLTGENRLLVKIGLDALNKIKRAGINELIEAAQIKSDKLDSWNIGFQIAPRINAAGRLDHANTAFRLLVTKDVREARELAQGLDARNAERQNITNEIMALVEKQINPEDKILIGVCQEESAWNEGVVGLVAGKICEKYYRPTLVITKSGDEYKGSGRSINELNIIELVEANKGILERYGGHAAACGFSLKQKNLEKFIQKIKQGADKILKAVSLAPKILIDAELDFKAISEKFIQEIDMLKPFGQANERPKFASFGARLIDLMTMGHDGRHIKLRLRQADSRIISAIGFSQAERWENLKIGEIIDIVYYLDVNEFNGKREIQLKIIDIKSHNL